MVDIVWPRKAEEFEHNRNALVSFKASIQKSNFTDKHIWSSHMWWNDARILNQVHQLHHVQFNTFRKQLENSPHTHTHTIKQSEQYLVKCKTLSCGTILKTYCIQQERLQCYVQTSPFTSRWNKRDTNTSTPKLIPLQPYPKTYRAKKTPFENSQKTKISSSISKPYLRTAWHNEQGQSD